MVKLVLRQKYLIFSFYILIVKCSYISISPFQQGDGKINYLEDISDTYFLTSKGMTKKIISNRMYELMEQLLIENDYQEYFVLMTGEIGRSVVDIRLTMVARVKFFKTIEEYKIFKESYSPFGK